MKASHNKVNSQTMPCLSALGIVLPINHPPSRTSTLPLCSLRVEKPITHLMENCVVLSLKISSFCPQGERSGRSRIKQWPASIQWISGCTIIFWHVLKLRFSEVAQVPRLLTASRFQYLMLYPQNFSLKTKIFKKSPETDKYSAKEAGYSWIYLNWTQFQFWSSPVIACSPHLYASTQAAVLPSRCAAQLCHWQGYLFYKELCWQWKSQ